MATAQKNLLKGLLHPKLCFNFLLVFRRNFSYFCSHIKHIRAKIAEIYTKNGKKVKYNLGCNSP